MLHRSLPQPHAAKGMAVVRSLLYDLVGSVCGIVWADTGELKPKWLQWFLTLVSGVRISGDCDCHEDGERRCTVCNIDPLVYCPAVATHAPSLQVFDFLPFLSVSFPTLFPPLPDAVLRRHDTRLS